MSTELGQALPGQESVDPPGRRTDQVQVTVVPGTGPPADAGPDDHQVRLGDLTVLIRPAGSAGAGDAVAVAPVAVAAGADTLPLDRLHLVVQNGRTFQQEHPDVPVLADKGRYLVVDLDSAAARTMTGPERVCYAVLPLPLDTAVLADAPDQEPAEAQPWVQDLVDRVSAGRFRMDLDKLVAYGTRYSTSSAYLAAATAARDELVGLGYPATLTSITVQGRPSWNVVADRPGRGPQPRLLVLVTAHLDSINIAGGPQALAPGADDNGSGSAGLLTIARIFARHDGVADLRLILFGGEEQGLFGSRQYVAGLDPTDRARVSAVVNMDMIGTVNTGDAGGFVVLLEGGEVSRPVIDGLAGAARTYATLAVQTSLHPFNSDHVPFIDAGLPAVLTIEGTDDANHHVHTDKDVMAYVNEDLAAQILRMNVGFVAGLLGRTAPDDGGDR